MGKLAEFPAESSHHLEERLDETKPKSDDVARGRHKSQCEILEILGTANGRNTPVISLLLATVLTIVLVMSNTSRSTAQLFIFVSLLTTTATLVVYLVGGIAALRRRPAAAAAAAIGASILFSLFAFYGAGLEANLWGLALLIAGLAMRWLCHRLTCSPADSSRLAAASPGALPE